MFKFIFTSIFLFFSFSLYSQQYFSDSILVSGASDYIKKLYSEQKKKTAPIYNGLLHYSYAQGIEGTAYFHFDTWQKGTLVYDNIAYEDVFMKYDLIKDQLIVTANASGSLPLSLVSHRVKEFTFSGLKFIYLSKPNNGITMQEGFYQELTSGKISALCKSSKTISETISGNILYKKFVLKKKYYLIKNNSSYVVYKKTDLLNALKEYKKEIQNFLKQEKLNYRKNPEQTIIAASEFYNKLEGEKL